MMSLRSWLALLLFCVLYLLVGGYIFNAIECPAEMVEKEREAAERRDVRMLVLDLKDKLPVDLASNLTSIICRMEEQNAASRKKTSKAASTEAKVKDCEKWSVYNSFFFSFTVITTIGYGKIAPETQLGRGVCILYSLLGVPINGILIGTLGAFFGRKFEQLKGEQKRTGKKILLNVLIYMVPGITIFLLLPSVLFHYIETDWTYLDSVYYAFISLATIGFGDLVNAHYDTTVEERLGGWMWAYQAFTVTWLVFGLGYIFMIVTVIADNLRKPARKAVKKFRVAEQKVLSNKILQELLDMKEQDRRGSDPYSHAQGNWTSAEDENDNDFAAEERSNSKPRSSSDVVSDAYNTLASVASAAASAESEGDGEEADTEVEDMAEHDTITSLGQFLSSSSTRANGDAVAAMSKRLFGGVLSSRRKMAPPTSASSSSISSRSSRLSLPANGRCPTTEWSPQSARSSRWEGALAKARSSSSRNPSLPELLRTTTLEDFIIAVEKVQRRHKSELEIAGDRQSSSRRSSRKGPRTDDLERQSSVKSLSSNLASMRRGRSKSEVFPPRESRLQQLSDTPPPQQQRAVSGASTSTAAMMVAHPAHNPVSHLINLFRTPPRASGHLEQKQEDHDKEQAGRRQ